MQTQQQKLLQENTGQQKNFDSLNIKTNSMPHMITGKLEGNANKNTLNKIGNKVTFQKDMQ